MLKVRVALPSYQASEIVWQGYMAINIVHRLNVLSSHGMSLLDDSNDQKRQITFTWVNRCIAYLMASLHGSDFWKLFECLHVIIQYTVSLLLGKRLNRTIAMKSKLSTASYVERMRSTANLSVSSFLQSRQQGFSHSSGVVQRLVCNLHSTCSSSGKYMLTLCSPTGTITL